MGFELGICKHINKHILTFQNHVCIASPTSLTSYTPNMGPQVIGISFEVYLTRTGETISAYLGELQALFIEHHNSVGISGPNYLDLLCLTICLVGKCGDMTSDFGSDFGPLTMPRIVQLPVFPHASRNPVAGAKTLVPWWTSASEPLDVHPEIQYGFKLGLDLTNILMVILCSNHI